jgi:predicted PurR-regulated permease PerM
MQSDREKIRQIQKLMLFGAVLVLVIVYSEKIVDAAFVTVDVLKPFFYGGILAIILNIPMKRIEEKLLFRWSSKASKKLKRPISILLSVLIVMLVVVLVVGIVVPRITQSVSEIGQEIPLFMEDAMSRLNEMAKDNPILTELLSRLPVEEINWDTIVERIVVFLKNGAGDMLNFTLQMAGNMISGIAKWLIAFVFAIYVLAQKEKLKSQAIRILTAYLPEKPVRGIKKVCRLLYRNFNDFITVQCLEACILGGMFIVSMSIFGFPYPVIIGLVIAITALVPVVGAFVGCAVGTFLIFMENPAQAVWFIVLFLVLQQIEGNLIYPKVVGNSVGLPAIWVLVAVSIGSSLFGIMGIFLGIPVMSTIYMLLKEDVNRRNAQV